ncbi:hypothetical protein [Pseudomonas matsuisoli]|uniref:Type III effector HrpK n=1 Tax=Pseudomonas matsuisoli TaxID=1515666 RepID=A0A917PN67_9PSED|nr:hypothetical protein [Pseudomonas matsuisoli]GGJ85883.1 hypothetical protein GCM10009304_09960 [Pseudomonas matsuisoli]
MAVKAAANTPVDSKESDSTKAWDEAAAGAREAGIRWEKPEDDKRSAQEIIDDSELLKNLGNQSGVKDKLKERVGNFENDADAAYRAAQVLEHIEKFDEKGDRLVGGDTENGKVDGFTSKGHAKNGSEAGRLQDFGKYGFTNLQGELNHINEAPDNKEAQAQAEALGIEWVRPEGDARSAEDIINDSPLLKNLGNQSGVKDMLKERVGDFENDADAAYRAEQVLEHVVKFDGDGNRLLGDDVRNDSIDGFTKGGDAKNGTEAGRLQDFGKYGFTHLKGELEHSANAADDKEARAQAEALGIVWERPENDKRTAQEIIDGDPLLKNLGNQSGIKDMLKDRVGDFENDADAAFRATQVLEHIETHDADGKTVSSGDVGNGSIDGMTKGGEAKHGTEAGRLQDFGKYGFSSLKGPEQTDESKLNFERESRGMTRLDELDVLSIETDQLADPKDSNSQHLTVSEATTRNLIDDYKARVESGELAKDSDEAKLVMALEAKIALGSGRGITGYQEGQGAFGGTWRESDDKQTMLTGKDHEDIIDGEAVDKMLAELFQTEKIANDYSAKLKENIESLPNRDALEKTVEETLNSTEYLDYLQDLSNQGKSDLAQKDVGAMLQSLSLLNEEKGKQASQRLMQDGIAMELNELVADPAKVDPEMTELATKDLFGLLKAIIKNETFDVPRRAQETIEKFINEFMGDKKKLGEVTRVIGELNTRIQNGDTITKADIEKVMVRTYTELGHEEAGKMANALDTLNQNGILGSLGGTVSVVSAFYQLFAKNGQLAKDDLGRLSVARDFLSFLGASQHFIKTGDKILGSGVADWMGLSKSVPAIWGKEGLWGKAIEEKRPPSVAPQIELDDLKIDEFSNSMSTAIDDAFGRQPPVDLPSGVDNSMYDGIADMFEREAAAGLTADAPKVPASTVSRIAGTVVKTLGASADVFSGVADIVLGAFTIKSGIANDSDLEKAAGSLQVVGGTLSGIAGGIGFASLFGSVGAAAAFTGPLFLAGVAILGVVGIIGYFIDHEKKQKATDKEGQWYHDLADVGLLKEDWGDKVEYARYSFNEYGGRDAPDDQSVFDYQAEEWTYFDDTPAKNGSSSNRLNDELHREFTA